MFIFTNSDSRSLAHSMDTVTQLHSRLVQSILLDPPDSPTSLMRKVQVPIDIELLCQSVHLIRKYITIITLEVHVRMFFATLVSFMTWCYSYTVWHICLISLLTTYLRVVFYLFCNKGSVVGVAYCIFPISSNVCQNKRMHPILLWILLHISPL